MVSNSTIYFSATYLITCNTMPLPLCWLLWVSLQYDHQKLTRDSFQLHNAPLPVVFLVASRCNFLSKMNLNKETNYQKRPFKIYPCFEKSICRLKVNFLFFIYLQKFSILKFIHLSFHSSKCFSLPSVEGKLCE